MPPIPFDVRKVCHGSRVVVEQPRIVQTRYTKDFGPGFYCTEEVYDGCRAGEILAA